jgi:UDP-glucuronate decarboxylase
MHMPEFIESQFAEMAQKLGKDAQRFEGKTLLINGAGGFLGNHIVGLIQYLNRTQFKKPMQIIALDNFLTGINNSLFVDYDDPNLHFIQHDVSTPFSSDRDVHFILHAASIASPVYYAKFPLETFASTVDGLRHTMEFARLKKPESVLYFSSSEIYGDPPAEHIPTKEDYNGNVSHTSLRACYDESKRAGETIATIYYRIYGVPAVTVRPFNAYGPGMKIDDKRVLPNFLNAAIEGKTIEIHNRGAQTRTFAYITDTINGYLRVLLKGRPGEAYNIGSDMGEISMYELAKKVEEVYGKPLDIQLAKYPEGYPVGDPTRRRPDITKARTELAYDPNVSLEDGIARMITWYQLLRKDLKPTAKKRSKKPARKKTLAKKGKAKKRR